MGRKATGLNPCCGYGSRVAGQIQQHFAGLVFVAAKFYKEALVCYYPIFKKY
ncbi:MAG: hypothetical protein JETT_0744 [Candidatus Jettenia ecosi]|uniref:Uncharacterized protein n=1 Tax=Candidatus Jettenia ecosi TaxID=2494326 RepID=A0A533QDX6_9BACT|nr:MAG: hypothetical protein JETT_0744 [Candidatus Jettenia ecosi]